MGSLTRLHNPGLVLLKAGFRGLCPNIGEFVGVTVFLLCIFNKKIVKELDQYLLYIGQANGRTMKT